MAHFRKEALVLRYFHGLSYAEVADALGVPLGTVKSRLNAALRALARELGCARAGCAADFPAPGRVEDELP